MQNLLLNNNPINMMWDICNKHPFMFLSLTKIIANDTKLPPHMSYTFFAPVHLPAISLYSLTMGREEYSRLYHVLRIL